MSTERKLRALVITLYRLYRNVVNEKNMLQAPKSVRLIDVYLPYVIDSYLNCLHWPDTRVGIMPGFQNVRYRLYSDIDLLTDVLALHERKIDHRFDKVSANLEDRDRRAIYSITQREHTEFSASTAGTFFVLILLATIINTIQRTVHKNYLVTLIIINNEHHRLLDSSIIMHLKKAIDTSGIERSIGESWSARLVIGCLFLQQHQELSDRQL